MTRSEIETALYQALNKDTASIDTITRDRLRGFVNRRIRKILTLPGMTRLRTDTMTAACTASSARMGLPYAVARVARMMDTSAQIPLGEQSLDWLRTADPAASSSGTPIVFVPIGYMPVAIQPSNASTLFWKSTSASDTQTAYLDGFDSSGLPLTTSTTLTGTTAVASSGSFNRIAKAYLSSNAVGTVTLHEDSGSGTQLGAIGIGRKEGQVYVIELWPKPSSAITYTIDYERRLTDLAQDTDVPLLPEDFHDLLILGAKMDEYEKSDDTRYAVAQAEYRDRLNELKAWVWWGSETARPVAGWADAGTRASWSPLGGWYPPVSSW